MPTQLFSHKPTPPEEMTSSWAGGFADRPSEGSVSSGTPPFAAVVLRAPRSPAEPEPPPVTGWVPWATLQRTVQGRGHAVPQHLGGPPALAFLLLPILPRPFHVVPRVGGWRASAGRGLRCPPRLGAGTSRVPASLWPPTHPGSPHRDAPWDSLRESCKTMRHGCFLPELSGSSKHICTRLKGVVSVSDIPGTFSKQPPTLRAAPAHAVTPLGPDWPSTAPADTWGLGDSLRSPGPLQG